MTEQQCYDMIKKSMRMRHDALVSIYRAFKRAHGHDRAIAEVLQRINKIDEHAASDEIRAEETSPTPDPWDH